MILLISTASGQVSLQDELTPDGRHLKENSRFKAFVCRKKACTEYTEEDTENSAGQFIGFTAVLPNTDSDQGWEVFGLYDENQNKFVELPQQSPTTAQQAQVTTFTQLRDENRAAFLTNMDGSIIIMGHTIEDMSDMVTKEQISQLRKILGDAHDKLDEIDPLHPDRLNTFIAEVIPYSKTVWQHWQAVIEFLKAYWPTMTSAVLGAWAASDIIQLFYAAALEKSLETFEQQPAFNFSNCSIKAVVKTLELYTDLHREGIIPNASDPTTPVKDIMPFLRPENKTDYQFFQTYGEFFKFITISDQCQCPDCPGDNVDTSKTDLSGCQVFMKTQTDVLYVELKDQVYLHTDKPVTRDIVLSGTLTRIQRRPPYGTVGEACGCSACPRVITKSSKDTIRGAKFGIKLANTISLLVVCSTIYSVYRHCIVSQQP